MLTKRDGMVKKIIGLDDAGKQVFERDARSYDQGIADMVFGIRAGDIVKAIPVIFLCGMVWSNQQAFNVKLLDMVNANSQIIKNLASENSKTLSIMNEYIAKMDSYLSAATGKRFRNGEPYEVASPLIKTSTVLLN